ncbi:MAG: hypothetical protein ABII12_02425, partial [Planctomycetota bacterium]
MTDHKQDSTPARVAMLRAVASAGRRLCDILLYDMEGEPRPHRILAGKRIKAKRSGKRSKSQSTLDRFVVTKEEEERLGHTYVKYVEWKEATQNLHD